MSKKNSSPAATLTELDLRGYRCPVPVIRLESALRKMLDSAQVLVFADDPVAAVDIPHFCRQAGHTVELQPAPQSFSANTCVFLVTRGSKVSQNQVE